MPRVKMLQLARDDFDRSTLAAHKFLKLTKHQGTGSIPTPTYSRTYLKNRRKENCLLTRNSGDGILLLRASKRRGSTNLDNFMN